MQEIIAVDNGMQGAIVHLDAKGEIIGRVIMPNKVEDGRNRVDEMELYNMFLHVDVGTTVVIERPVGSQSVNAATSMADSYARTVSAFNIAGLKVKSIAARTWQSKLFKGVDGKDTKDKAAKVFKVLFPECVEEFSHTRKGNKSKNLHDGLCDAALIAYFCQKTNYEG